MEHLRSLLILLILNEFFANLKKCSFGRKEVEYLGHIISGAGVAMYGKKLDAVLTWPMPKTVKSVRRFLGLAEYYRRFIEGYGEIARPLNNLLKKEGFKWGKDSAEGIGAVLSQNKKAIAYFSKPLYEASLRKSVYEKELMALVLAIQHWRPYLVGRKFTIYTDQEFKISARSMDNYPKPTELVGKAFGV